MIWALILAIMGTLMPTGNFTEFPRVHAIVNMVLTELTHREPRLASRRVEELYALLEYHGDDTMRAALSQAVAQGHLSVAGVRRALHSSARGVDGDSQRPGAAQPRGEDDDQIEIPFHRAESRGGVA